MTGNNAWASARTVSAGEVRVVTRTRTSGTERGWTYLDVRGTGWCTIIIVGEDGALIGGATGQVHDEAGSQTVYREARSAARRAKGLTPLTF